MMRKAGVQRSLFILAVFAAFVIFLRWQNVRIEGWDIVYDTSRIYPMSAEEVVRYGRYALALPATDSAPDAPLTAERILAYCAKGDASTVDGQVFTTYTSDTLPQYLTDCEALTDLTLRDGSLYISYATPRSEAVSLVYSQEGLLSQSVYDERTDTAYFLCPGPPQKQTQFRFGAGVRAILPF